MHTDNCTLHFLIVPLKNAPSESTWVAVKKRKLWSESVISSCASAYLIVKQVRDQRESGIWWYSREDQFWRPRYIILSSERGGHSKGCHGGVIGCRISSYEWGFKHVGYGTPWWSAREHTHGTRLMPRVLSLFPTPLHWYTASVLLSKA